MENKKIFNIIIACSGSVATIKLSQLLQKVKQTNRFNIKVVLTEASKHFIKQELQTIKQSYQVIEDFKQWQWKQRGDPVMHVQLRKWADILIIAPLSANTLAKIVNGICDNTLSLIVRCWDFLSKNEDGSLLKPIIVCPSMNTFMYQNPITAKQLKILTSQMGIRVIDPVQKILVCGDKGTGAMASVLDIVNTINQTINTLQRKDILII